MNKVTCAYVSYLMLTLLTLSPREEVKTIPPLMWHHRHYKYSKVKAKCISLKIMARIFPTIMNNKYISKTVCTFFFCLRKAKLIIWSQWTVHLVAVVILHLCCHSHNSNEMFALGLVMNPSFKFQFLVVLSVLKCVNIQVLEFVMIHLKKCTRNGSWKVKILLI